MASDQRTHNSCVVKNSEVKSGNENHEENHVEAEKEVRSAQHAENSGESQANSRVGLRAVSLRDELRDLELGLSAVSRLQAVPEYAPEEAEAVAQETAALMHIIYYRLILDRLMVEGKINPAMLWSMFNDAGTRYWDKPAESDVVFVEWTATQKVIQARAVLDNAEREVAEELIKSCENGSDSDQA